MFRILGNNNYCKVSHMEDNKRTIRKLDSIKKCKLGKEGADAPLKNS